MASCKEARPEPINIKTTFLIHNKFRLYAKSKDSSMTAEFEKWVGRLKLPPEYEEELRQSLIEK